MENGFERKVRSLTASNPAYTADAYRFVSQAVTHTVENLPEHRHVSALELLHGARSLAIQEYGAVAREVLQSFGLYTASDLGKVVYLLIGAGLLSASDDDDPEDFNIDFELVPSPLAGKKYSRPLSGLPVID